VIPYGTPERFRDLDPGQRETLRERAAGEDIRPDPAPAHFQLNAEWAAGLEAAEHRALRDGVDGREVDDCLGAGWSPPSPPSASPAGPTRPQ